MAEHSQLEQPPRVPLGELLSVTYWPPAAGANLVAYLHRLGCSVASDSHNRLRVRVAHPETVEDEVAAIREWCAAWAKRGRDATVTNGT